MKRVTATDPKGLLRAGIKAVPAVKYAAGVAGIASALALAKAFFASIEATIIGVAAMFLLMTLLVIFSTLAKLPSKKLKIPATIMLWVTLSIFVTSAILLISTIFFDWPKPYLDLINSLESAEASPILAARQMDGIDAGTHPETGLTSATGVATQASRVAGLTKIVVANIDGPEDSRFRVTDTLTRGLKKSLEPYEEIQVIPLGESISEREEALKLETLTSLHGADIIIWGWYGITGSHISLHVSFHITNPALKRVPLSTEPQVSPVILPADALQSFQLQINIKNQMQYLSLFIAGLARFLECDWDEAIYRFRDALRQESHLFPEGGKEVIYYYLGFSHLRMCRLRESIEYFDKFIATRTILQVDPRYSNVYLGRGNAHFGLENLDLAISDYSFALAMAPDLVRPLVNRSHAYLRKEELDKAIADASLVIELEPESTEIMEKSYFQRSRAHLFAGNEELAKADFARSIEYYYRHHRPSHYLDEPPGKPDVTLMPEMPLGSRENPIRASGVSGQLQYLNSLGCPDGATLSFSREGSLKGIGPYGHILDSYLLRCEEINMTASVAIDLYHRGYLETRPVPGFRMRKESEFPIKCYPEVRSQDE